MFTFSFSSVNADQLDKMIEGRSRLLSLMYHGDNAQVVAIHEQMLNLLVNISNYVDGTYSRETTRYYMARYIKELRALGAMGAIENLYMMQGDFHRLRNLA